MSARNRSCKTCEFVMRLPERPLPPLPTSFWGKFFHDDFSRKLEECFAKERWYCKRMPEAETTSPGNWCGEYRADPAKATGA